MSGLDRSGERALGTPTVTVTTTAAPAAFDAISRKPEHTREWKDARPSEVAGFLIDVERVHRSAWWVPALAAAGLLFVGAALGAAITDGITWGVAVAGAVGGVLLVGAYASHATQTMSLRFICADFRDWIDEWPAMFPGYNKNSDYIKERAEAR